MKSKFLAVASIIAVFCAAQLSAQNINTVSYVPVKRGFYDKISTKSKTILAQDSGNVTMTSLKANSHNFALNTDKVTFGKPVIVANNLIGYDGAQGAVQGNFVIDGLGQFGGNVGATNTVHGVSAIEATNLDMPAEKVDLSSSELMIDGVAIPAPSCTLVWKEVNAKTPSGATAKYALLGCSGSGGGGGGGSCTFSGWSQVASQGTTTCGSIPFSGCVEYALCSDIGQSCSSSLVPKTEVVVVSDVCGHSNGWLLLEGCSQHCSGMNSDPSAECVHSASPNCPSSNICASLGTTGSCISSVISDTCGAYTTTTTYQDYSSGCDAHCKEDLFMCNTGNATVEKITCVQSSGNTYYKRTCN